MVLTLLFSCTVPRHYQYHQPFVFAVNVKVEGNFPSGEKRDLETRLSNQLDDSLRPQIVSIIGLYRKVMNPPVFDTANIRRSIGFMNSLLNALGYNTPAIKDTVRRDTVRFKKHPERNEYRVTIDFTIYPGTQMRLDSIGFNLSTPALQALALEHRKESFLKKGLPYSKQLMSNERDRLVNLFHNNGYYYFTKDDLVFFRDSVVSALIDPNLDPFQQAALLEELKKKREHPTINVEVSERPVHDSTHITKYYVGHINVYPDLPIIIEDTVTVSNIDTSAARGITLISRANKFKPWVITDNVFVRPGSLYRQQNVIRTLNRFNQMGAWQQSTMSFTPSDSSDSVLDGTLKLYPAVKQFFNADYEVARNTNDIVTATNLFGINANLGLRNRNAYKQSVLTSTTLRGGVELGSDFIQTTQASISHTISFPRLLPRQLRLLFGRQGRLDSLRSVVNVNASYIDRHQFFTMRSINGSFGWERTWGNRSLLLRPINIEYTQLSKTDSFNSYLQKVPSLNLAFKSGLVLSSQVVYKIFNKYGRHSDFVSFSGESSGGLAGLISRKLDEGALWRFVKGEVDYRHHIDYRRSQLAFHAYAGAGWAYGREGSGWEQTLPFYKAFFAGGPNSMRGWQVRQLGLGSSKFYDTAGKASGTYPLDRFGDVQLEGNIEYRFPIGTLFNSVKVLSAIYVDAGNIWDRHVLIDSPAITKEADKGSDFQFNRFYREFAVDAGTGLRFDFDWFIIRFDWAYKLKDPQRQDHSESWFYDMQLFKGQFQLGIGYPF
ncbi:BamA/TamA family outer membrane protein [Puia sp.]|uniref:BamA/TamA family outer membrane protein n=1 Tax=Puia sp. TaxID=2045100 RepID=UPI002F40F2BA